MNHRFYIVIFFIGAICLNRDLLGAQPKYAQFQNFYDHYLHDRGHESVNALGKLLDTYGKMQPIEKKQADGFLKTKRTTIAKLQTEYNKLPKGIQIIKARSKKQTGDFLQRKKATIDRLQAEYDREKKEMETATGISMITPKYLESQKRVIDQLKKEYEEGLKETEALKSMPKAPASSAKAGSVKTWTISAEAEQPNADLVELRKNIAVAKKAMQHFDFIKFNEATQQNWKFLLTELGNAATRAGQVDLNSFDNKIDVDVRKEISFQLGAMIKRITFLLNALRDAAQTARKAQQKTLSDRLIALEEQWGKVIETVIESKLVDRATVSSYGKQGMPVGVGAESKYGVEKESAAGSAERKTSIDLALEALAELKAATIESQLQVVKRFEEYLDEVVKTAAFLYEGDRRELEVKLKTIDNQMQNLIANLVIRIEDARDSQKVETLRVIVDDLHNMWRKRVAALRAENLLLTKKVQPKSQPKKYLKARPGLQKGGKGKGAVVRKQQQTGVSIQSLGEAK